MNITIEYIQKAIDQANEMKSSLSEECVGVPMLGSLKIRHLLNNLGGLVSVVGDFGCHRGGSYCSIVNNNLNIKKAYCVDSWASDHMQGEKAELDFRKNLSVYTPIDLYVKIIKSDVFSFDLSLIDTPIELYSYDCGHSYEDQKNALLHFKPILADTFIYVCDDWQYGDVKAGTMDGIKEGNFEVLFSSELLNPPGYTEDQHLNDHWWRGYAVFILKKK